MSMGVDELALQAELQKLAGLLGCEESEAAKLSGLDVEGFRRLRAACTARLYDGDRAALQRLVSMSAILPMRLKALISEKAMGPVLASRVAGLLPPEEAAEIATRVSLAFNVEVTLLIDPRSAVEMLRKIPVQIVVDVTRELVRRKEVVVMGRFVDALTDEQIQACTRVMDDECLLRSGFYVESADRLEEVTGLMTDKQVSGVVSVAADPALGLGGVVLRLLDTLGPKMRARMVESALVHDNTDIAAKLVTHAREAGMLEMLRSVLGSLSSPASERLENLIQAEN